MSEKCVPLIGKYMCVSCGAIYVEGNPQCPECGGRLECFFELPGNLPWKKETVQ